MGGGRTKMVLSELYLAAWMAGGVLAACSLLLGNFGRAPGKRFTPTAPICAVALGLVGFGSTGVLWVLWVGPSMPWPAAAVGVGGVALGAVLQRMAARHTAGPEGALGTGSAVADPDEASSPP